jgi:hypothetical protein
MEPSVLYQLLVYVHDVDLFSENMNIMKNTETSTARGKEAGLEASTDTTKYTFTTQPQTSGQNSNKTWQIHLSTSVIQGLNPEPICLSPCYTFYS